MSGSRLLRRVRRLLADLKRISGARQASMDGIRVWAGSKDIPSTIRRQLFRGVYEDREREFVQQAVRRGDRVLELGCGIGVISLVATKIAGEGQVHSLEANPSMEPVIKRNYALNGWTPNLRIGAVTKSAGRVSFEVDENILSSSLAARDGNRRRVEVEGVPINTLIADVKPDVIIADVEGAEIQIFDGEAQLADVREIVMEVHPGIVGEDAVDKMLGGLQVGGFSISEHRGKVIWLSRTTVMS